MLASLIKKTGLATLIIVVGSFAAQASTSSSTYQEYSRNDTQKSLPDLRKYPSGTKRKTAFLNEIVPVIERKNNEIRQERLWLQNKRKSGFSGSQDLARLQMLCTRYKVTCNNSNKVPWETLLARVDTVPTHLVVAQAVTESGWGTSRLAQENNNLFGVRCHSKRCSSASSGKIKGYTRYDSVNDSVAAYLNNINTNNAYRSMRESRAKLRQNGDPITAYHLVDDLDNYSERGSAYTSYLRDILSSNQNLIHKVRSDITSL